MARWRNLHDFQADIPQCRSAPEPPRKHGQSGALTDNPFVLSERIPPLVESGCTLSCVLTATRNGPANLFVWTNAQLVQAPAAAGADRMLGRLIKESRAVIDAVAVAQPRTWADVHAIIVAANRGAAKTAKG